MSISVPFSSNIAAVKRMKNHSLGFIAFPPRSLHLKGQALRPSYQYAHYREEAHVNGALLVRVLAEHFNG
jgi:hypothetical protein